MARRKDEESIHEKVEAIRIPIWKHNVIADDPSNPNAPLKKVFKEGEEVPAAIIKNKKLFKTLKNHIKFTIKELEPEKEEETEEKKEEETPEDK